MVNPVLDYMKNLFNQTKSNYENPENMLIQQLFGSLGGSRTPVLNAFGNQATDPQGNPLWEESGADTGDILAVLKFLQGGQPGGGGGGGGGSPTAWAQIDLGYAQLAQRQAEAQADQLYKEALIALQQGDQKLARQQFAASEEQRAIANDLAERGFQYTKEQDATQNALTAYSQMENANIGRGNLQARGAEAQGNLASDYGNLLARQQELALEQLKTPRNAIASFLIGQGMDTANATEAQQAFNPANLFGLDAGQLPGMFQSALSAAQNIGAEPVTAPDIAGFLKALQGFAGTSPTTGNNIGDGMEKNRPEDARIRLAEQGFNMQPSGNYRMAPNQSAWTQDASGRWVGPANQDTLRDIRTSRG